MTAKEKSAIPTNKKNPENRLQLSGFFIYSAD
jgi:hypothetical protein